MLHKSPRKRSIRSFYGSKVDWLKGVTLGFDRLLTPNYTTAIVRWPSSAPVRRKLWMMSLVSVLFSFVDISKSLAQQGASTQDVSSDQITEKVVDGTKNSVSPGESLALGDIDAAPIPIEKKKSRVESMLVDERSTLGRVVTVLANARKSKDIVKLHCVNEKLIQVKGLLKISEQSSLRMYEAIANNAQDLVNHEFTKVVVAHQKSQQLRTDAEKCVGENAAYAGDSSVDVEVDADADGFGSDTGGAAAPPPGPVVPPVASTF